jgi:hypothetical protein
MDAANYADRAVVGEFLQDLALLHEALHLKADVFSMHSSTKSVLAEVFSLVLEPAEASWTVGSILSSRPVRFPISTFLIAPMTAPQPECPITAISLATAAFPPYDSLLHEPPGEGKIERDPENHIEGECHRKRRSHVNGRARTREGDPHSCRGGNVAGAGSQSS